MGPQESSRFVRMLAELRRRRVFRVVAAYAVAAWLIIQIASDVFPALHLPDWTVTLVVVLVLLGFPIALGLAWAYDLTAAGVVRTPLLPPESARAGREAPGVRALPASWRIAVIGASLVLALAGGAFVVSRLGDGAWGAGPASEGAGAKLVAVLPFQVRGSERLAYLGEGIVDLLSTDLGRSGVLETVDPNQLLAALGGEGLVEPHQARQLAAQFGAGMYLLGSVFEVEGRVRLTASLYDRSRGGRPVATRTVEGEVSDILPLVARLATELAGAAPAAGAGGVRLVWAGDSVDVLGSPSADGRLLSFTDWSTGDLAVRDLRVGTNRRLTGKGDWSTSDDFAEYSRISPDGRRVAYAWYADSSDLYRYELRVADVSGGAPRTLLVGNWNDWIWPQGWTRGASAILASLWRGDEGRLTWVDAATAAVDTIRTIPSGAEPFRLSPDDRWIAYHLPVSGDERQRDIHVMAADGSQDEVVVRSPADDVLLDWSPDGRHLLFWSDRGTAPGVWAVRVANGRAAGEPMAVRSDMWWLDALGFAGEDFLYTVTASERQVHIVTLDLEQGTVTDPPAPAVHASAHATSASAWSPDGTRLAYLVHMRGGAPLTSRLAVRDVATGVINEYPVMLHRPRLRQWLDGNRLLLEGRPPGAPSWGHYALHLASGNLSPYEVGVGRSPGAGAPVGLVVSADGRSHYFFRWVGTGRAELLAWDATTRKERVIGRVAATGVLALSSDGTQLAFSTYRGRAPELAVVPVAGGTPRAVHSSPDLQQGYRSVAWSRDGRFLVYTRSQGLSSTRELGRVRLADGQNRVLLRLPAAGEIAPHPDGRRFTLTIGDSRTEIWALEHVTDLLR